MRLKLLNHLDDLLETCKGCDKRSLLLGGISPEKVCNGCHTYSEIKGIREQLLVKKERKKVAEKVVLDQDSYSVLKGQGKSDADIARQFGIKQPTLSYYKKKWTMTGIQPVTEEVKPIETKTTATVIDTKTAEYDRLIQALRNDLKEAHNQCDEKDEIIRKLEHVNAACEDVENETASLIEEKNQLQWEYDKLKSKEYHTSYTVENQMKRIKDLGKTLERYEEENKALRSLLRLWM